MKTWEDVRIYIACRNLPCTVMRFNMSRDGRLIDTATGELLADTVRDAERVLLGRS